MSSYVSVLDLFSVGLGPSSSHTVGPMRAATAFVTALADRGELARVSGVRVVLCGSLGATGVGHGTPDAVVAGLVGLDPETCDPDLVPGRWEKLGDGVRLPLLGWHEVVVAQEDVRLAPLTRMPGHPNGMRFTAVAADGAVVAEGEFYSVGGGFVLTADEITAAAEAEAAQRSAEVAGDRTDAAARDGAPSPERADDVGVPFPFANAAELLALCEREGTSVARLAWANEVALRPSADVEAGVDRIWDTMSACVDAGLEREGVLPGRLQVRRRARAQRERLEALERDPSSAADLSIEWLQAFAMAVNEENADGRRVVTAPTNGAAGIIPAVGRHFLRTHPDVAEDGERRRRAMRTYLLTAAAIGALYKRNASISGAEAGCQGEVGSACSMAAGALCAVVGGTPAQVENAAEIAMEHNLGLTCDPVGGLVQVPCIERNAIAACTAVSAARLALQGDGSHVVSLDTVIETMRQTGADMSSKYKETSTGGLAVNVIEC
ncbi:L-serine ammonia-lyase [Cellulosimicrobium sp. CUA-896]|uniref:L-serine ammonia-lyase n=1 Tax=Cellulosimicrobium sp. CUA-896 TaxID=1517881 RepID=UPI0009658E99|nr:L-serine ammonia-lyase [Cellulosimicrobium sp. CUA-896]OLT55112.1 L-serine ammonia-lyase [Cellulosimicrobium sp. CUA-896]